MNKIKAIARGLFNLPIYVYIVILYTVYAHKNKHLGLLLIDRDYIYDFIIKHMPSEHVSGIFWLLILIYTIYG